MFGKKKSRILFFILGPVATPAQIDAAEKLGAVFRNANACGEGDAIEKADGVCGAVPAGYLNRKNPPKVYEIPAELIDKPGKKVPAPVPVAAVPAAPVAPVTPPAPVVATTTENTPVDPAIAERRAQEDAGAANATAAQLKEALTQLGIKFATNTPKPELLALYLARP